MNKLDLLVPLDDSDFSRQVLPVILRSFQPQNVQVTLLHVTLSPDGFTGLPPKQIIPGSLSMQGYESAYDAEMSKHPIFASQRYEDVRTLCLDHMEHEIRYLKEHGFDARCVVRFGEAPEEIVAYAQENHVDMVVMASHGRSGLSRLVMGSVAEAVMRRLSIPVLMVRPNKGGELETPTGKETSATR